MIFPHGEPRAYVERDFSGDLIRIHLAVRTGDDRMHVLHHDGTVHTYEPDHTAATIAYERPWLSLTDNMARKLLDELAAFYGGVSETRMLRKDYDAERARVDRFITYLTRGQGQR